MFDNELKCDFDDKISASWMSPENKKTSKNEDQTYNFTLENRVFLVWW